MEYTSRDENYGERGNLHCYLGDTCFPPNMGALMRRGSSWARNRRRGSQTAATKDHSGSDGVIRFVKEDEAAGLAVRIVGIANNRLQGFDPYLADIVRLQFGDRRFPVERVDVQAVIDFVDDAGNLPCGVAGNRAMR